MSPSTMDREILLPNIGDFSAVDVIDVLIKPGAVLAAEAALVTLESDKATMDIPSPYAGTVRSVHVKVGDKLSEGQLIAIMATDEKHEQAMPGNSTQQSPGPTPAPSPEPAQTSASQGLPLRPPPVTPQTAETVRGSRSARAHASPSIRRFARELGVELGLVQGSGNRGRILLEDVKAYARTTLTGTRANSTATTLPEVPAIDFSKFGPVELKPLNKVRRLTGQALHRSWLNVPMVTQFDSADITDLEQFRVNQLPRAQERGVKLTLVTFLCKAVVVALKAFPDFNASLTSEGDALVHKKYFHLGIAVNTDNGLFVPVLRDVDQKGLFDIAREIQNLSEAARKGVLEPRQLQGSCFTVSSLGGTGGSGFTPIVNAPEVAILGVSRATMQPVWRDNAFIPRLTLPFALTYDHRVIDGAAGAQFTQLLNKVLSDIRQILL